MERHAQSLPGKATCCLMQAASHGPRHATKGSSTVVPINAGSRALKSPAFQASPQPVPTDTGLASRYARLVPGSAKDDAPAPRRRPEPAEPIYTEQQIDAAIAQCQHYAGAGIDDKHITAFQEDWAVNAVSMLPHQERYISRSHTSAALPKSRFCVI